MPELGTKKTFAELTQTDLPVEIMTDKFKLEYYLCEDYGECQATGAIFISDPAKDDDDEIWVTNAKQPKRKTTKYELISYYAHWTFSENIRKEFGPPL